MRIPILPHRRFSRTSVKAWNHRTLIAAVVVGVVSSMSAISLADASSARHVAISASRGAKVTGKMNVSGYTIVALGTNGKYISSKARSFSLRVPASTYTLQLIDPHGRYAGPVVVSGHGRKVDVGLRGAVHLGRIVFHPSKGYATLARPIARSAIYSSRWAWAVRGVPIGNGRNLGLVISPTKGTGPSGPGGDSDRSGIANAFDIASGGNRIISALAPAGLGSSSSGTAHLRTRATTSPPAANNSFPWMSQLFLPIDKTVNEDAANASQSQLDSTLVSSLNLKLLNVASGSLVELNCNGLSYCKNGGTGTATFEGSGSTTGQSGGTFKTMAFPSGSLDPATGYGEIVGPAVPAGLLGSGANPQGNGEFSLNPNATSSQIGSGDVITEIATNGGVTTQTPTTINFVFNTVPAIASYSDTAGDSGTISYPDTTSLGTSQNPIKVAPGPNGDVVVTFTLYRPQRAGIPGAGESSFMDIGHLWYSFDSVQNAPNSGTTTTNSAPQCSLSSYSTLSPTLSAIDGAASTSPFKGPAGTGMLVDSSPDKAASSQNTISFTIDISACMTSKGQTFTVGQPTVFDIQAASQASNDHTNQTFYLERTK